MSKNLLYHSFAKKEKIPNFDTISADSYVKWPPESEYDIHFAPTLTVFSVCPPSSIFITVQLFNGHDFDLEGRKSLFEHLNLKIKIKYITIYNAV